MENASKALIIAGAILISILIIAIGMYIYSSSTNSINEGIGSMSTQEKEAFNANWTNYEGNQTGSQVKGMISKLIANANTNQDAGGKVPEVIYKEGTSEEGKAQYNTGATSNAVEGYITNLNTMYKKVKARGSYTVDVEYSGTTSLINKITITKAN